MDETETRPATGGEQPDVAAATTQREDGPDLPDIPITETHNATAPGWSRRRTVTTGLVVGAFFGAVFFGGYAATAAWICSARLTCGHWAPIAIVAASGMAGFTIAGATFAYVMHRMYRLFKVA